MQFDKTRAWKDEEYRQSLSQEQQAQLPESPAGELELSEAELELVNGTGDGVGGKGGGKGGYTQGYGFAGGIVGNSYYCGNFSIRPTTNLNLGEDQKKDENQSLLGTIVKVVVGGADHRRATVNRFDFSCTVSFNGVCFGGGN